MRLNHFRFISIGLGALWLLLAFSCGSGSDGSKFQPDPVPPTKIPDDLKMDNGSEENLPASSLRKVKDFADSLLKFPDSKLYLHPATESGEELQNRVDLEKQLNNQARAYLLRFNSECKIDPKTSTTTGAEEEGQTQIILEKAGAEGDTCPIQSTSENSTRITWTKHKGSGTNLQAEGKLNARLKKNIKVHDPTLTTDIDFSSYKIELKFVGLLKIENGVRSLVTTGQGVGLLRDSQNNSVPMQYTHRSLRRNTPQGLLQIVVIKADFKFPNFSFILRYSHRMFNGADVERKMTINNESVSTADYAGLLLEIE